MGVQPTQQQNLLSRIPLAIPTTARSIPHFNNRDLLQDQCVFMGTIIPVGYIEGIFMEWLLLMLLLRENFPEIDR